MIHERMAVPVWLLTKIIFLPAFTLTQMRCERRNGDIILKRKGEGAALNSIALRLFCLWGYWIGVISIFFAICGYLMPIMCLWANIKEHALIPHDHILQCSSWFALFFSPLVGMVLFICAQWLMEYFLWLLGQLVFSSPGLFKEKIGLGWRVEESLLCNLWI